MSGTDLAQIIEEPRRRLSRVRVRLKRSIYDPPSEISPTAWNVIGPLYIIAETLIEHGFIEVKLGTLLEPVRWRFKTRGLPPRVRSAVRDVYRWAMREHANSGTIFLQSGDRLFMDTCEEDLGAALDGQCGRWVPVLRQIVHQRNNLAKLAGGTMLSEQDGRPLSINGVSAWPRLADFVFALDQGLDRIADKLRREMIRRYLNGEVPEDQKRQFVDVLQAHHDGGMWPDAERDICEIGAELGFESDKVVPLRP